MPFKATGDYEHSDYNPCEVVILSDEITKIISNATYRLKNILLTDAGFVRNKFNLILICLY